MMMTYNDNIAKRLIDTYITSIYIYIVCIMYIFLLYMYIYI